MSFILENLWKRATSSQSVNTSENILSWNKEIETLYELGINMEDTIRYLFFEKPDWETFMIWINNRKKETMPLFEDYPTNVLSDEDLLFWNEKGYVIIKEAISQKDCEDTRQAIWNFLGMHPDKKETWYNKHEEQRGLMLNFSDHETLNKNRFSPKIKKAYEQLYKTSAIYKTIDKVSFNPPETDDFHFRGSRLHWDVSLKLPIPFALQGLLYLTDCGAEEGAFHCVPGFHNKIEPWLKGLAAEENPREKILEISNPIPITANAGDFIIWQNSLPHSATPNRGSQPRMVQYLTYLPNNYKATSEWI
ncbi:phytanoyl-CoA dioxygenase family protein [Taibaiella lutea]|uniref:Phytanoyl-CoA dioxygenase family protein n=1 Tax=Taibaiella lutea TaxID=2608001 RepID=A0A5M6CEC3_9BACT|nr:phytanoyl-CoA dioxygenase family protein [Taibaiella lutea]KAA5533514.1 phytanoyl-CoA dioxygenase family protein [Taibaiella lutea]